MLSAIAENDTRNPGAGEGEKRLNLTHQQRLQLKTRSPFVNELIGFPIRMLLKAGIAPAPMKAAPILPSFAPGNCPKNALPLNAQPTNPSYCLDMFI